jgi:cytosine/adenosine deaminase-related metal-dependent hydrolase
MPSCGKATVESLHKTFALANRYDKLIDVHCDEIDDEQSRFVGFNRRNSREV